MKKTENKKSKLKKAFDEFAELGSILCYPLIMMVVGLSRRLEGKVTFGMDAYVVIIGCLALVGVALALYNFKRYKGEQKNVDL